MSQRCSAVSKWFRGHSSIWESVAFARQRLGVRSSLAPLEVPGPCIWCMQGMATPTQPLEITSDSYDGRMRCLTLRICEMCRGEFYAPRHVKKRYCSRDCSAKASKSRCELNCDWCGGKFEVKLSRLRNSKKGLHFCSRSCKDRAQRLDGIQELHPPHYGTTTGSSFAAYRKQALRIHGARCRHCGYSEDVRMLDVDHIDGNRDNNDIRNWQVLCVWCHALKTRGVPPHAWYGEFGAIAQPGERLLCRQEVASSTLAGSTAGVIA
jgi:hypothetical protein